MNTYSLNAEWESPWQVAIEIARRIEQIKEERRQPQNLHGSVRGLAAHAKGRPKWFTAKDE